MWVADSTPVECARSRETVKRSELPGFAEYGPSLTARTGQTLIADKNYFGAAFETVPPKVGSPCCVPPARASPNVAKPGSFKPLRQVIESINDTLRVNSTSNIIADTPSPAS